MTTYKFCKKCEQTVIFKPPQPIVMKHAIVHYLTCFGGNEPHFCKQSSSGSIHDACNCDCLTRTNKKDI